MDALQKANAFHGSGNWRQCGGRMRVRSLAAMVSFIALTVVLANPAYAHIKWFMPYDLSEPPRQIGEVINTDFFHLYLVSTLCIFAFFWIDRFLYRKRLFANRLERLAISQEQAFWIMRGAASIVFGALFVYGLTGDPFLLTPELRTPSTMLKWLHLVMALAVLCRPTVPLTGVGIFVLYGLGIADYGRFHMLDYLMFLGIGVYFLLAPFRGENWIKLRYITLFATTGLSLLWGALEKLAYPQWTYPLLEQNPELLMGMSPAFYMTLAAFVEFNLVFILLASASVFSRFIALGLNTIFILAIFKFGMIDAIGHLVIIAVLVILTVRGPTSARYFLVLSDKSLWTEAYFMTGLYMLALNVMFMSYYGLHALLH
jgi:hypothetical protein